MLLPGPPFCRLPKEVSATETTYLGPTPSILRLFRMFPRPVGCVYQVCTLQLLEHPCPMINILLEFPASLKHSC